MKAAFIETTGSPDVIRYGDLPTPTPKTGEVLVRVGAAALNPIDLYIRAGIGADAAADPVHLGCDLAGTVEAVGPGATRFKIGDRVWGSNQGLLGRQGTFAEYAAVHEDWLYPTPAGVDDVQAAAAALVGITAHLGLFECAKLQAGRDRVRQRRHGRRRRRWWCRWPRRSGPRSSRRSARRRRRTCAAPGAPTASSITRRTTWTRASASTPRARASTSGTRRSASRISCGRWT